MPGLLPQLPVSVSGAWSAPRTLRTGSWTCRNKGDLQGTRSLLARLPASPPSRCRAGQLPGPVSFATNARQSPASAADSDTARCPCPTCPSARNSTGRPDAVACCNAAHILYACSGSTRVSLANTVNSTAGYATPSVTRWYGEYPSSHSSSAADAAVPYSVFHVSPSPNRSYRTMSSSGAEQTTAENSSGRCVSAAP